MRVLVDACISKFAVDALREVNHDVVWMPEEGLDPGDSEILNRAFHDDRILITADKDFVSWYLFFKSLILPLFV